MAGPILTAEQWRADVKARGGVVTVYPYDDAKKAKGKPAARFPDKSVPLGWRYELAPATVQLGAAWDKALQDEALGDLALVEKIEAPVKAVANAAKKVADKGALGLAADVLGVPTWLLVGMGLVIGYGALVQAGIVPPLRKVMK